MLLFFYFSMHPVPYAKAQIARASDIATEIAAKMDIDGKKSFWFRLLSRRSWMFG